MKVLNLYAGIGGNRKLWKDVDVTAVEIDPQIARVYQDYFPDDKMVIGDAHQYLLDHFREFDFIWSSPPCQTHSDANYAASARGERRPAKYPDMSLYQEIILLKHWFEGKWVAENVIPYYTPLIPGKVIDRHLFWSNFNLGYFDPGKKHTIENSGISDYEKEYGYDLSSYGFDSYSRRQKLRNCVHPETGLHIIECARGIMNSKSEQTTLFI